MPTCPFGRVIYDAITRRNLGYAEAVELINAAGKADGEKTAGYNRTALTRWLTGTIPNARTQRWIASALEIPSETLAEAADAQRAQRYRFVPGPIAPAPVSALTLNDTNYDGVSDWPAWFALRVAKLTAVVESWQGKVFDSDGLQALLHQEILMFDAVEPESANDGIVYSLSRRQALITLAALPLAMSATAVTTLSNATAEAFLAQCAASITASWHLLRGRDLTAVDQLLSSYLVPLAAIAQHPSAHQQTAARLASQAHRICGIVALHRDELKVRERHCQQALQFATIATDQSAEVSALVSLASTYYYSSDPKQAATVYEGALTHERTISALQRSRIHAELAVVYGQVDREHDALRSVAVAEQLYPGQPEQDRSFLYAEFTPASLALERGLTYMALGERYPDRGYQRVARDIFEQFEPSASTPVPDRIRFEIVNHQATTAVLLGDLDAFEVHFAHGIEGARRLRSKQRFNEALGAWRRANRAWPQDRRLEALNDRTQPTASVAVEDGEK